MKVSKNILLLVLALCAGASLFAANGNYLLTLRSDTTVSDTTDPASKKILVPLDTTEVPRLGADDSMDVKKPVSALEAIEDEAASNDEIYSEDWDTASVHVEKFDVLAMADTINLPLIGSYTCGYNRPINGRKTSDFGFRRYRYHFGVDLDLETGDTVTAAFDGKVRIAQKSKTYGNVVVIRHNSGLETYYAHLSKLLVKPGEEIHAGEVLGLGGNTGHSHGSHLHFETRYKGQPIDPNSLIDFQKNEVRASTYALTKSDFKYLTETYKVTHKSRKGKRTYSYYTPGGPKMATPEARAIMAGVAPPKRIETGDSGNPIETKATPEPKTTVKPAAKAPAKTPAKPAATTKPGTAKPAAPGAATYVIKKGDSLYAIALKNHTTVDKLCKLNGIKPTTTLAIGRKIKLK